MTALVGTALALAALYAAACLLWPYTACTKCDGAGRIRSPGGKAFRRCRRCQGTGERERWGHRLTRRRDTHR